MEDNIQGDCSDNNCNCAACFKRACKGAADVSNAKQRLMKCLSMQESFIQKYEERPEEKRPPTYDTRVKLFEFFSETLQEFDVVFKDKLQEYQVYTDPTLGTKKRKRFDK